MLKELKKILHQWPSLLIFFSISLLLISCEDDSEIGFTVDFSFKFIDDNHVRFSNNSEGEYYSLNWDFDNGETVKTTDKSKTYNIYYPEASNYNVSLSALNYTGESKLVSKTVSITKDDFILSFSASIDVSNPNVVNLENTSIGEYDSFKWLFKNDEIENEMTAVAYFPFSGQHEIELQVIKARDTFSLKETVNIIQDDPDYINKLTLVWSDEFDGTGVNKDYWTFETGATGWGNNELQNYTNGENVDLANGKLVITAKKVDDNKGAGSYTSTRMITKGKKEFTYGKMEIRAKLPSGTGIWAAIWMLGGNISSVSWPACGEIDIMEYVGYQPNTIHATVHTTSGSGANGNGSSKTLETAEEEFHIYGLIWTPTVMTFYTDQPENVTHTYAPETKNDNSWPFYKPQFFILNIAVGGNWGGAQGIDNSIFPQTMEIDYVRVYQ